MPAIGGEARQITTGSSRDYFPQWSPDGKWLAFTSNREDGLSRLWWVPTSGGPPERLTEGPVDFFRFSPDGKRIYYLSIQRGSPDISALTLVNRHERRVTRFSKQHGNLAPEGLAVGERDLYFIWQNNLGDIWVMDVVTDEKE
jgi:Tol biopolymer transport system component